MQAKPINIAASDVSPSIADGFDEANSTSPHQRRTKGVVGHASCTAEHPVVLQRMDCASMKILTRWSTPAEGAGAKQLDTKPHYRQSVTIT
jgi:hypothetical protein